MSVGSSQYCAVCLLIVKNYVDVFDGQMCYGAFNLQVVSNDFQLTKVICYTTRFNHVSMKDILCFSLHFEVTISSYVTQARAMLTGNYSFN